MTNKPDHAKIRRWSRHRIDVRLTAFANREAKELKFTGQASDISIGGMAVHVAADLQQGEPVRVELTLPYSRLPLRVDARVNNRTGNRYGLEFVALSIEQRDGIQRLCDTLTLLET